MQALVEVDEQVWLCSEDHEPVAGLLYWLRVQSFDVEAIAGRERVSLLRVDSSEEALWRRTRDNYAEGLLLVSVLLTLRDLNRRQKNDLWKLEILRATVAEMTGHQRFAELVANPPKLQAAGPLFEKFLSAKA